MAASSFIQLTCDLGELGFAVHISMLEMVYLIYSKG